MHPAYLFVYGTLRKGQNNPAARFLSDRARWIGRAKTSGKLYRIGAYPGMVQPACARDWVCGDLFELKWPEETLAVLDRYEGCDLTSSEFERCLIDVTIDDRTLQAWAFRYRGDVTGREIIPSGEYLN